MGKQITRCVIVGASPFSDAAHLKTYLRADDVIFAADGGTKLLEAMGIVPHAVIGDFDSAASSPWEDIPVKRLPTHKDDTDVFAAAKEALSLGFREFLLLGCLGGRLDHTVSNLFLLRYLWENGASGVLVDECHEVRLLASGTHIIPYTSGYYCSLLPYGGDAEGVTVKGAEYPLENATLDTVFPLGVSNGFLNQDITVSLKTGFLLTILAKKDEIAVTVPAS